MKQLSIIIPLYNSASWLEKCLSSVLTQDIPEAQLEVICINDGSPDDSANLARCIGKAHPCIIVIDQKNLGPSGARNTGMRYATGKYLMFVDPDDYVEPNTFGALVKQMEEESLDMLRFNFRRVDEQYKELPVLAEDAMFDYTAQLMTGAEFLSSRLGIGCNIWRYIYRTEIITRNQIWCYTGDYFDDTPWLPLVLMKAEHMNICNTIVYDYLERQDGLVRAQSEHSIQRKIDGHLLLQQYLHDQLTRLDQLLPSSSASFQPGVTAWYQNMIAFSTMKFLSLIAEHRYAQRSHYLQQLYALNVFPLHIQRMTKKSIRKIRLINLSPCFYMFLIHLKANRNQNGKNVH